MENAIGNRMVKDQQREFAIRSANKTFGRNHEKLTEIRSQINGFYIEDTIFNMKR